MTRKLSFLGKLRIAFAALFHRRTPFSAKALIAGGILYGILPLDLVPDILPVIGLSDDAAIIVLAILAFLHLTKELRKNLEETEKIRTPNRPID